MVSNRNCTARSCSSRTSSFVWSCCFSTGFTSFLAGFLRQGTIFGRPYLFGRDSSGISSEYKPKVAQFGQSLLILKISPPRRVDSFTAICLVRYALSGHGTWSSRPTRFTARSPTCTSTGTRTLKHASLSLQGRLSRTPGTPCDSRYHTSIYRLGYLDPPIATSRNYSPYFCSSVSTQFLWFGVRHISPVCVSEHSSLIAPTQCDLALP